ncbi:MAG: transposase [Planctomycetales bacterium]|nr:transposase [Planctomycetales bacterium]
MGRPLRASEGGWVYHVLNRANARLPIFDKPEDYDAFERILTEGVERYEMRLLAYCLMPNHWHLLVWPQGDGDLSRFMGWVTLTHTQRWHAHRGSAGTGHVYQGRFKSFPVQEDEHFYSVGRYVERNALRAKLVKRAEDWRWGSLWRMTQGDRDARALISAWPLPRPRRWLEWVNEPQTDTELAAVRHAIQRGSPYGDEAWADKSVRKLGLETTLRPRGRPRKPGR